VKDSTAKSGTKHKFTEKWN